jgi:hypothetical protein
MSRELKIGGSMKKFLLSACIMVGLSACASHSENIEASDVSPLQYQDYSCHQIRSELMRVSRKVNQISGAQDKQAGNDEAAMGVGLILFWPALFFLAGSDHHIELAQLKGEYDALEEEAIQKNCDVAKEIKAAQKAAEERKAKEQTKEPKKRVND